MTAARNVSANSSAVTDRRYSHPERSRGIPLRKLASPIVTLRQARDLTYSVEITQSTLASFATLSEVPQSEPDWRCIRGSG